MTDVGGATPRQLVAEAARRLADAGVASPDHDAAELLAHVLGTSRAALPLQAPVAREEQHLHAPVGVDVADVDAHGVGRRRLPGPGDDEQRGQVAVEAWRAAEDRRGRVGTVSRDSSSDTRSLSDCVHCERMGSHASRIRSTGVLKNFGSLKAS